ncbi:MAG: DUF3179 domain-containing (seleno)protein [Gaiellaceae bacterium]
MRLVAGALALVAIAAPGCTVGGEPEQVSRDARYVFPAAPTITTGPLDPEVASALDELLPAAAVGALDRGHLGTVARSGDARLAWVIADLLRFYQGSRVEEDALVAAFERLTEVDPSTDPLFRGGSWRAVADHLIAWDTPAPPRYREHKAVLYLGLEPGWAPFFDDPDAEIDWRRIAWGGVLIDDSARGDHGNCLRGCIPALDDPALTSVESGGWYPNEGTVFGVVVEDEAVAFPKNVMETHELVNLTLGGRRLGIPYCTLCGSAQAYLTDAVPARFAPLVLRTTGLLQRSNKLMYDLGTGSAIDTFTGRALSGPLRDAGVVLDQVTVFTSTWGEWKTAYPRTRIVARDGGVGRTYLADPLRGRDDDGPIFPVGDIDPRLPAQVQVVGVIAVDGDAVAFPAEDAREVLRTGGVVELSGVGLVLDGGGLRARSEDGRELPAHQAFWFAWSQFHPGTTLWSP